MCVWGFPWDFPLDKPIVSNLGSLLSCKFEIDVPQNPHSSQCCSSACSRVRSNMYDDENRAPAASMPEASGNSVATVSPSFSVSDDGGSIPDNQQAQSLKRKRPSMTAYVNTPNTNR